MTQQRTFPENVSPATLQRDELASIIGAEFEHPANPNCQVCADTNRAAGEILAEGYVKAVKVEWGIFRASDPDAGTPLENLPYKTRESAELARRTQFTQPDVWEVRGRSVAPWSKP